MLQSCLEEYLSTDVPDMEMLIWKHGNDLHLFKALLSSIMTSVGLKVSGYKMV